MSKYFLTAGIAALLVRGKSSAPVPPPNMIEATFLGFASCLYNSGACMV
jgi:hypothetical protein